jgi:hypothetical protein
MQMRTNTITAPGAALAALGAACGLLCATVPAARAADPGFTCRSSVLRAQLAAGAPIEPLAANRLSARCGDDVVGLESLGAALPGGLGLDMAFASTASDGAPIPAARRVEARAAAALVDVPGTSGGLQVEGV